MRKRSGKGRVKELQARSNRQRVREMLAILGMASYILNSIRETILTEGADTWIETVLSFLEHEDDKHVIEGICSALITPMRNISEGINGSDEYLAEFRAKASITFQLDEWSLVDEADRQIFVTLLEPANNERILRAVIAQYSRVDPGVRPLVLRVVDEVIAIVGVAPSYLDEFERTMVEMAKADDGEEESTGELFGAIIETLEKERTDPVRRSLGV